MGSTTDWIQAIAAILSLIITGAGTYFVIETLKLQQRTLDDQKTMLQLAVDEEKISQQPTFSIQDISVTDGPMVHRVRFRLSVEDKTAYNVTLHQEPESEFEFTDLVSIQGHIQSNQHIDIEVSKYTGQGESLALTVIFCDIKRRYYRQKVFGDSFHFRITLPKPVNH